MLNIHVRRRTGVINVALKVAKHHPPSAPSLSLTLSAPSFTPILPLLDDTSRIYRAFMTKDHMDIFRHACSRLKIHTYIHEAWRDAICQCIVANVCVCVCVRLLTKWSVIGLSRFHTDVAPDLTHIQLH